MIADPAIAHPDTQRLQLRVAGAVQGVGFRPYVYHLARALGLTGWIQNTNQGVLIELEGTISQLQTFQARLPREKPSQALLHQVQATWQTAVGYPDFTILPSPDPASLQPTSALILPDLATCPACLADISNPTCRHYRYPFTNCTHCGPRFTIMRSLPYDRARTSLHGFPLCPACQAEYDDPSHRRFHAQPNACPDCGPHLELWDRSGQVLANRDAALQQAVQALRAGQILAMKGVGGFHLLVDARNDPAVQILRDRKRRPAKPLAVMFPTLDRVHDYCQVDDYAAQLLQSPAAPIVLLPRHDPSPPIESLSPLAAGIAPDQPCLGAMLPYTPLHHLLLTAMNCPVVATSGNRCDEPICSDNDQAVQALAEIADVFLVHNRPIVRPVDDSILQIVRGQAILLRRARGYAPLPIALPASDLGAASDEVILAVGGHLKNTVALYVNQQLLVSQHLGNLDQVSTCDRFQSTIHDLCRLYHTTPTIIACDAHPDYHSTQFAQALTTTAPTPRLITVQHHYAHILSGIADNQWQLPVLGVAWDGTGYGLDNTIWGGEFLWLPAAEPGFVRAAHLRPFPLPGGELAAREPRRCAIGLLYECLGELAFDQGDLIPGQSWQPAELAILKTMLQRGVNTPRTSSIGRLFDAIAAILGLGSQVSFEGQAAQQLEWAIAGHSTDACYPYQIESQTNQALVFNYQPMVQAILQDRQAQVSPAAISATFHNTLVAGLVEIADRLRNQYPELTKIVLTGGCFQNRYLLERAINRLQKHDFVVGHHHQIPSNDGGLAVGQVVAALRLLKYQ